MAGCIVCDEWAGPDSDRHEHCVLEFEASLRQPDILDPFLRRLGSALHMAFAPLPGFQARMRQRG